MATRSRHATAAGSAMTAHGAGPDQALCSPAFPFRWPKPQASRSIMLAVTNLARSAERVVAFYNQRGTAEQWIREGKGAIKWTRLSCRSFAANAVRLPLHALAYSLGNFMRTLARPKAVAAWSLTSLRLNHGRRETVPAIGDRKNPRSPMAGRRPWPSYPDNALRPYPAELMRAYPVGAPRRQCAEQRTRFALDIAA
jgi:hypothetical protein